MMVWEYRHGLATYDQIDEVLREMGEQGWELVQVLPAPHYMEMDRRTHYDKMQYFLKRLQAIPVRPDSIRTPESTVHVLAH